MLKIVKAALNKFPEMKFVDLFRLEFEALIQFLVGSIPGGFGMVIRNTLYRPLLGSCKGTLFIQPRVTFVHMNMMFFEGDFSCNTGTYLNAKGSLRFGSKVLVGSNVTISSGIHPIDQNALSILDTPTLGSSIQFGDDVWIGAGVVVLPGVSVGRRSVIGANSVVTKSIPENKVAFGIPARVKRERF